MFTLSDFFNANLFSLLLLFSFVLLMLISRRAHVGAGLKSSRC